MRPTTARIESTCDRCHGPIRVGDPIVERRGTWIHRACWERDHE
ncbi:hypothetical protein [Janibacter terrae]